MKHVLMLLICSFVIQGKYRLFLSNFSIRNLVYLLVFFCYVYEIFCLCLKHFYFKEKKMNGLIAFFVLFCVLAVPVNWREIQNKYL